MTVNTITAIIDVPVALVAMAVGLLALTRVVKLRRAGECSQRMYLILGVGITWTGVSLRYLWWGAWRGAKELGWTDMAHGMENHWLVIAIALMILLGGITHLRTLTRHWYWPRWLQYLWDLMDRFVERAGTLIPRRL